MVTGGWRMSGLQVVNLDIEAATEIINRLRYIETGDEWDDKINDIAAEAVNAALGITKDDELAKGAAAYADEDLTIAEQTFRLGMEGITTEDA